jgi:hypothetical protein
MENKQVLTEEELKSLKEIQEMYNKIISDLGQIDLQIDSLEKVIGNLAEQKKMTLLNYGILQQQEKTLGKTLSDKYGDGTIDPTTGEFTPNK